MVNVPMEDFLIVKVCVFKLRKIEMTSGSAMEDAKTNLNLVISIVTMKPSKFKLSQMRKIQGCVISFVQVTGI